jgi:hypothetical protein
LAKKTIQPAGTCQVCGGVIEQHAVYCVGCATPHHEDCFRWTGQCSTFACGGQRYFSAGDADSVREVSPPATRPVRIKDEKKTIWPETDTPTHFRKRYVLDFEKNSDAVSGLFSITGMVVLILYGMITVGCAAVAWKEQQFSPLGALTLFVGLWMGWTLFRIGEDNRFKWRLAPRLVRIIDGPSGQILQELRLFGKAWTWRSTPLEELAQLRIVSWRRMSTGRPRRDIIGHRLDGRLKSGSWIRLSPTIESGKDSQKAAVGQLRTLGAPICQQLSLPPLTEQGVSESGTDTAMDAMYFFALVGVGYWLLPLFFFCVLALPAIPAILLHALLR